MEDEEFIHHSFHEHPLKRIPNVTEEAGWRRWCYGCWRYFLPEEAAYGCNVRCGMNWCLHQECAEMAREIRHPVHPPHPLTVADLQSTDTKCAVCVREYGGLGYVCSRGCELWIHLGCTRGLQVAAAGEQVMKHPSHPQHELRFLRRKKRSCSFECDACGMIEKGNSYICSICQYWIHERCSSLPTNARFHHHPDHSLSLVFYLPSEYIEYDYACGICNGALRLRNWVYHCELCRYIVHINCATNAPPAATSSLINEENADDDDDKCNLKAPIDDIYEKMIIPFVEREKREIIIPNHNYQIITGFHHHPLNFTAFSSSSSSHDHIKEDDDDDDDQDDDLHKGERSEFTCDGCTLPIQENSSRNEGYLSCGECKYFLHLACFNLPIELSSHPLHQIEDSKLILSTLDEPVSSWIRCSVCYTCTNGLFYSCIDTECDFIIDIKCASLPETIKHAGHPQLHHYLKLLTNNHGPRSFCSVCHIRSKRRRYYKCGSCRFCVCCACVFLPGRNKHRLEKHWLPLTYDASVNHPSDFYCSSCEEQMNPKSWMYHCRDCDQSFHRNCFPATSGECRNINFGMQHYRVSYHPHHSLRFQLIWKKKRCDVCHDEAYDLPGYQCTSCNFVMCFREEHSDDVSVIE